MGENSAWDIEPVDGCIILGQNSPDDQVYVTRYHINHPRQRDKLCEYVLLQECLPFLDVNKMRSIWRGVWALICNEVVLFSMHIVTIFLGVMKTAHPDARKDELIHTVFENIVTCLLIIIRTLDGWIKYEDVKDMIYKLEHVTDKRQAKGWANKMWLVAYSLSSVCLVVITLSCFACFYFYHHLGWTVLSNQFCLVVILLTTSLFSARMAAALQKISIDQYKAIVWEAVLLLKESHLAKTDDTKKTHLKRLHAFTNALENTPIFELSPYIDIHASYKEQLKNLIEMNSLA